jgi:hypothetical protein
VCCVRAGMVHHTAYAMCCALLLVYRRRSDADVDVAATRYSKALASWHDAPEH